VRVPSTYYYTAALAALGLFAPGLIDWIPKGVQICIVIAAFFIWLYSIFLKQDEERDRDDPRRAISVVEHELPGLRWDEYYGSFFIDLVLRNAGDAAATVTSVLICAMVIDNEEPFPREPIYTWRDEDKMKIQCEQLERKISLAPDQRHPFIVRFHSYGGRALDDNVDEDRATLAIYGYVEYVYLIDNVEKRRRQGFIKAYKGTGVRWDEIEELGVRTKFENLNNLMDWSFDSVQHYNYDIRIYS
jgi:hypothetical protein